MSDKGLSGHHHTDLYGLEFESQHVLYIKSVY